METFQDFTKIILHRILLIFYNNIIAFLVEKEIKLETTVDLYSMKEKEISRFLEKFLCQKINLANDLEWEKSYHNPIEMADIIGVFIENKEKFEITMWISIDKGFSINVTENNADQIIRYLYERFPY